jgi:ketosteroid isomerase-like protein
MSARKQLVETYFEGFRRGDHAMVLECLTEDVIWDLPGYTSLAGKEAFDGEIANPEFTGLPTLLIDHLLEDGDVVAAIGTGHADRRAGGTHHFAYCDAFTFRGDLIGRVESYVVPLP